MAVVSITSLIPRVRQLLEDEPFEDYTTGTITAVATSQAVNQGAAWAEGDVLEYQDDGDLAKVRTGGSSPLTIKRSHAGATASSHASGVVLFKNPDWRYLQIQEALTRVVDELWPQVWQTDSTTVTPTQNGEWYNLVAGLKDVVSVVQLTVGTPTRAVFFGQRGGPPFTIQHNLPTSLVGSGIGIRFPRGVDNYTNTVAITYRSKITTADIEDGLMSEAVIYGACWRLLAGKAATLSEDEGVREPIGNPLQGWGLFKQLYEEKLDQLSLDLADTAPRARRWVR